MIFSLKKILNKLKQKHEYDKCMICLSNINKFHSTELNCCKKNIHTICLYNCFDYDNRCPNCRRNMEEPEYITYKKTIIKKIKEIIDKDKNDIDLIIMLINGFSLNIKLLKKDIKYGKEELINHYFTDLEESLMVERHRLFFDLLID